MSWEEVLGDVHGADEVAERLARVLSVAEADPAGRPFLVPQWSGVDGEDALALLRRHFASLRDVVGEDKELEKILTSARLRWSDAPVSAGPLHSDDDPAVWLYDAVSDRLISSVDRSSALALLRPAALSIAADLYLAAFALWPVYRESWAWGRDSFAPYASFWEQGLSMAFSDETTVVVSPATSRTG